MDNAELQHIQYVNLTHQSPEFDAAYDVISLDIDPEFVEPKLYIRERFRIQEEGAKTDDERRMVPEGYRIRAIAAKDKRTNKVVGAILSDFVPKIGKENRGFALIGYVSVLPDFRRREIGTQLIEEITKRTHDDALKISGKLAVGLLFEIEDEGKEPIERLVRKMGGYPLDIDYYQPSVRAGYDEQQMNLWLFPFDQPIRSPEEAKKKTYPTEYIHDMVKSLFIYEYPGQDRSGFKETSKAYQALIQSLRGRTVVGFKPGKI